MFQIQHQEVLNFHEAEKKRWKVAAGALIADLEEVDFENHEEKDIENEIVMEKTESLKIGDDQVDFDGKNTRLEESTEKTEHKANIKKVKPKDPTKKGPHNVKAWLKKYIFNENKKQMSIKKDGMKVLPKFYCSVCTKMYSVNAKLADHMAIHESVLEMECCRKQFLTKYELNLHQKNQHGRYSVLWGCEYDGSCSETFSEHSSLLRHMELKHFGPISTFIKCQYKCKSCDKLFSKRKTVRSHSFECAIFSNTIKKKKKWQGRIPKALVI